MKRTLVVKITDSSISCEILIAPHGAKGNLKKKERKEENKQKQKKTMNNQKAERSKYLKA